MRTAITALAIVAMLAVPARAEYGLDEGSQSPEPIVKACWWLKHAILDRTITLPGGWVIRYRLLPLAGVAAVPVVWSEQR